MTVPASILIDEPKFCGELAVSSAVCVISTQPLAGLTNTYAFPLLKVPNSGAPITTVFPLIETASPKSSLGWPSEAVSLAVWVMSVQPPEGLTKT